MRRALALLLLAAAGVAGCGDSADGLIPQRSASRLLEQVEAVEAAMAQDPPECDDARDAAETGRRRALELPRRVDDELQANLVDWFDHLENEARQACNEREEEEETPTATPTATEEPEETPTAEPTETPTAEPTETPTAEPTEDPGGQEAPDDQEQGIVVPEPED